MAIRVGFGERKRAAGVIDQIVALALGAPTSPMGSPPYSKYKKDLLAGQDEAA